MHRRTADVLRKLVFNPEYPGYRPNVVESPNGDGKQDSEKRYAHVAYKYQHPTPWSQGFLDAFLVEGCALANEVHEKLGLPEALRPLSQYSTLRVIEYPPGAISHEHTDFDLFTLMLYRNQPDKFVSDWHSMPAAVKALNSQCHLGELGELLGAGPATKHSVLPSDELQVSVVFFAIPDHAATLPDGTTVGDWLAERISRSRYDRA